MATGTRGSGGRMSLQLPAEEKPFLRSSTSPTIVVQSNLLQGSREPHSAGCSPLPSPKREVCTSLSPHSEGSPQSQRGSPKHKSQSASNSRKNSFVAFLTLSHSSPPPPEETTSTNDSAPRLLSPSFQLPKSKVKLLKKTASVKQLYNSVLDALRTISRTKDDLMPELTKTFFEKILRDSEQRHDLQVTKVKVKDSTELGRHFCSEVHAVDVHAKLKGADTTEVFKLIIKSQPVSEDARKFLQPQRTFEKEVQMYATVFVDMANFVKSQGIIPSTFHESEIVDIPKCYYTRCSSEGSNKDDMIIMENLIPKGFVFIEQGLMGEEAERQEQHVELTVREIAKFHAISYCMKAGSCEALLQKYSNLKEDSIYRPETYEFTARTLTPVLASLAELIRSTPQYSHNYQWFVELAKNFHSIQTQLVQPSDQFGVVCHGDLWWSNILFRYPESCGRGSPALPESVKFIDFQSARLASLATDLLSFAFTSLSSSSRRTNMQILLQHYHTTFLAAARSLNFSGELFSLQQLREEFEDKILFGFLEGIWYLDIIYQGQRPTPPVEEPDVEEPSVEYTAEEELEAAEIRQKERELRVEEQTEDQELYRRDFFAMLEDVTAICGGGGVGQVVRAQLDRTGEQLGRTGELLDGTGEQLDRNGEQLGRSGELPDRTGEILDDPSTALE